MASDAECPSAAWLPSQFGINLAFIVVGLAIPVSIITTFAFLYFADVGLNLMSLGGLSLAAGMLVDNSIVVIESIFRHRNELGEDARTAALAGTSEVAIDYFPADPALEVCRIAGNIGADLIVVGCHQTHRRYSLGRVDYIGMTILEKAPCAVMLIPLDAASIDSLQTPVM